MSTERRGPRQAICSFNWVHLNLISALLLLLFRWHREHLTLAQEKQFTIQTGLQFCACLCPGHSTFTNAFAHSNWTSKGNTPDRMGTGNNWFYGLALSWPDNKGDARALGPSKTLPTTLPPYTINQLPAKWSKQIKFNMFVRICLCTDHTIWGVCVFEAVGS